MHAEAEFSELVVSLSQFSHFCFLTHCSIVCTVDIESLSGGPSMKRVGVFGATGYTGQELIQILARHPHVEIVALSSQSQAGADISLISNVGLANKHAQRKKLLSPEEALNVPMDVAFFCLSHSVGAQLVSDALKRGIKVIDLSADYRFKSAHLYKSVYGVEHPDPESFGLFEYGLPELFRDKIRASRACANPGCYPTTVALALAPLLKPFRLSKDVPVIVDAKSGVTGAGRKPTENTHFVNVYENFRPYNVGRAHRHVPEMEQTLSEISPGFNSKILFTPGLLPVSRGMISSVYVQLSSTISQEDVFALFQEKYSNEPFIEVLGDGSSTPDISRVRGTNQAVISLHVVDRTLLAIVAIDNLLKGASGQAVQNLNLMMGFRETDGLIQTAALN